MIGNMDALAQNTTYGDGAGAAFGAGVMIVFVLFGLGMAVMMMIVHWKIMSKTGNNGALSLLMLVPLVNLGVYVWLAFSKWPIEEELASLKARKRGASNKRDDWD